MSLQKISLLSIVNRSFTVFISILLLSHSVVATASTSIEVAQQPQSNSQDANIAAANTAINQANQLLKEGQTLLSQRTTISKEQALAKYDEALKILRKIDVNQLPIFIYQKFRNVEATVLQAIGSLYHAQKISQKALKYLNEALSVRQELQQRLEKTIKDINSKSNLENKQQLLNFFQEALYYNNLGKGWVFDLLGSAYLQNSQPNDAIKYYEKALWLFNSTKQLNSEANTLTNIALLYQKKGSWNDAISYHKRALNIQRSLKDFRGQANTLKNLGVIYVVLDDAKQAVKALEESLKIFRQINDVDGQNEIRKFIESVKPPQKKKTQKLLKPNFELQQNAEGNLLTDTLASNKLERQYFSLFLDAGNLFKLGNYDLSIQRYKEAHALIKKIGNPEVEADLLVSISRVYDFLGEKQQARDSLNEALKLQTDISNLSGIADIHNTSAQLYISSGEYQEALNEYDKVLAIELKIYYPRLRAITLIYIANLHSTLGEYQKSIDNLTQAKKIFDKIPDRAQVARTYQNIGNIYLYHLYQSLKDDNPLQKKICDSAEDCYKKALNLSHELGDTWLELSILQSIVRVNVTSKKYEEAEKSARQILSLSQAQSYSMWQAIAYNEIARVYQASGNYQKALDYSNKALKLYQKLQLRDGEAGTLGNIGKTYKSLRQYKQAIDAHNKELALWDNLSDKINQAEAHYNIAVNQSMVGNDSQALRGMEQTIAITEGIRSKVDSQELRTSYFATVQKYYEFYIDLLMQLHKKDPTKVCEFKTKDLNIKDRCDAVALHMSERARARSLVELLTEANANIREGIKPELLKRERYLQQKLDALEKQILKLDNEDIKQQINKFRDDYQQLRTEIRRQSPRYAALKFPEPLTLKEIQQKVLDDDTLLLTYSLGEERSYLWLVSKTEIHSYELPKRTEIDGKARQFHDYLKTKPNQSTFQAFADRGKQSATKLSQILLQPVANKLGKKRLLIVSDGWLQYVPFTALPSPEHTSQGEKPIYLLENHEIINSPSASTIDILRSEQRKPAPKTLAVLADPVFSKNDLRFPGNSSDESPKQYCSVKKIAKRETLVETLHVKSLHSLTEQYSSLQRLENTCKEAHNILELVQEESERIEAFGFDANRAFATNPELSKYRYVVFATHGDLNSTNPELSSLVLSLLNKKGEPENGYLRLNDIFNLNLPAELVVLSACDTGLGKLTRGEGLVGLTRGFMYAGSPRLVVSLWKIADDGTAVLMKEFFTKMLKEGLKPAEALRAAQKEMLKDEKYEKYSAPYYWAAFTLQGEWR